MPQIIVVSEPSADGREAAVMHRERVNATDLQSHHFARQLLERLGWAVGDADTPDSRVGARATR
jgi:hypothetical protein